MSIMNSRLLAGMDETARAEAELEALLRAKMAEPQKLGIEDAIGLLPSMLWVLRKIDQLRAQLESERALRMGQLERAWHVIANAHRGGNGWLDAPPDWQAAAAEFREQVWLPALRARDGSTGLCKVCGSRPGCGELRGLCELCHRGERVDFVLAGGDFTGKDEHAFAEAVKTAARRGATALHAELKRSRRRARMDRAWRLFQCWMLMCCMEHEHLQSGDQGALERIVKRRGR